MRAAVKNNSQCTIKLSGGGQVARKGPAITGITVLKAFPSARLKRVGGLQLPAAPARVGQERGMLGDVVWQYLQELLFGPSWKETSASPKEWPSSRFMILQGESLPHVPAFDSLQ